MPKPHLDDVEALVRARLDGDVDEDTVGDVLDELAGTAAFAALFAADSTGDDAGDGGKGKGRDTTTSGGKPAGKVDARTAIEKGRERAKAEAAKTKGGSILQNLGVAQ